MTTHDEIMGLRHELFRDDVYRAVRVFNDGQLWLDVGCHIGLFTTLAEAHGALVAAGDAATAPTTSANGGA